MFCNEEENFKLMNIQLVNLIQKKLHVKNLEISLRWKMNQNISAITTFGQNLAIGTKAGQLHLYTDEGISLALYETSISLSITCLLSLQDTNLIVGTTNGFYILDPNEKIQKIKNKDNVFHMIQSGNDFICLCKKGRATKFDVKGNKIYSKNLNNVSSITELSNKNIILGTNDKTIHIMDSSFNELKKIDTHKYWISNLIQLDGGRFASLSYDSTCKIFSSEGIEEHELQLHGWAPVLVKYSFGRFLTGSRKGNISLWSSNGCLECEMIKHQFRITSILVLSDERILSIDDEGLICVWNRNKLLQWFQIDINESGDTMERSIVQLKNGKVFICCTNEILILN